MARISTKDHANLPLEKWNTTTYHAYLIDENARLFDALYTPFGKGSVSQRWQCEKGQIKQAIGTYGNAVIKRYIEICLAKYNSTAQYPALTWGFMWAYMRQELAQAQQELARERKREAQAGEVNNGLSNEEIIDLL